MKEINYYSHPHLFPNLFPNAQEPRSPMTETAADTGLKPGAKIVLDYLLTGKHLSNMIAYNGLGVGSLTSRVSEINAWIEAEGKGFKVVAEWRRDHFKKRYKSYVLVVTEYAADA